MTAQSLRRAWPPCLAGFVCCELVATRVVYGAAIPDHNAFAYPDLQLACDMLRRPLRRFERDPSGG